jgi:type IV pilus assembly protein PilO
MSVVDELRRVDFNNLGALSSGARTVFCAVVVLLILAGGYYFKTRVQRESFDQLVAQESQLRSEFETKQKKAANLEANIEQLDQMKLILQQMLRKLPSKTEMPDLLVDISQTALSAGIQNELFEPQPEIVKDFYAEKPITLRMVGTYHQFGDFVSGVASLPRVVILTMHDIALKPTEASATGQGRNRRGIQPGGALSLEGTVKTYRYLDDSESLDDPSAVTPAAGRSP